MTSQIGSHFVQLGELIYETGIAQVRLATCNGQQRCVKIIKKSSDPEQIKQFDREKTIGEILLSKIHQNIIKFYDLHEKGDELFFLMEKGDCNLAKYIKTKQQPFEEREIFDFLFQITSGYLELIELRIIHRDLKAENIILQFDSNQNPIYKIIDFGISKIINEEKFAQRLQTPIQCSMNTAPEMIFRNYDNRCDIYSLGLIILKIYNSNLVEDKTKKTALDTMINAEIDLNSFAKPKEIPEQVWHILLQMITHPDKRTSWHELNELLKKKLYPNGRTSKSDNYPNLPYNQSPQQVKNWPSFFPKFENQQTHSPCKITIKNIQQPTSQFPVSQIQPSSYPFINPKAITAPGKTNLPGAMKINFQNPIQPKNLINPKNKDVFLQPDSNQYPTFGEPQFPPQDQTNGRISLPNQDKFSNGQNPQQFRNNQNGQGFVQNQQFQNYVQQQPQIKFQKQHPPCQINNNNQQPFSNQQQQQQNQRQFFQMQNQSNNDQQNRQSFPSFPFSQKK